MHQAALQDLQKSWQLTSQHLSQQEAAKLQQMDRAMQSWRDDFQKQLPVGKLKAIENKLTALEGTVLSAGHSRSFQLIFFLCQQRCHTFA